MGEIDCQAEQKACQHWGVKGVPSFMLIRDGKVYKFKGARELSALESFAEGGWQGAEELVISENMKQAGNTSWTAIAMEALTELLQQLSAIFKFSPFASLTIFMLGFFGGASLTGLVVMSARERTVVIASPKKKKED